MFALAKPCSASYYSTIDTDASTLAAIIEVVSQSPMRAAARATVDEKW